MLWFDSYFSVQSEEDRKLLMDLEVYVDSLQSEDQSLYVPALEGLRTIIRSSTTSVTSVPKPLKFMRPYYATMKEVHAKITNDAAKKLCADIISALAMTCSRRGDHDCLKYHLLGSREQVDSWGHEYVRHLSCEISTQWEEEMHSDMQDDTKLKTLKLLTREIVPYFLKHNGEAEACDFLMEMEDVELIEEFCDAEAYPRICLYLMSCVPYVPEPENSNLLWTVMRIYLKFGRHFEALRCALMLNDMDKVKDIFLNCDEIVVQKQMAFLLARHQVFIDIPDDLDIMEPKVPEDVYKTNVDMNVVNADSARANLASSFVNGFVNTGFCVDKLITEDANSWFYKNKDHAMISAAASQGLIYRWDVDNGLTNIDKFLYSNDDNIKAGSLLAVGVVSCGVHHECDPAQALLLDYVQSPKNILRICSTLGLGLAYANSKLASVEETIVPQLVNSLSNPKNNNEISGIIGLALGFILVSSANNSIATLLWQFLLDKEESELKDPNLRLLVLGIALIYLGRQDAADVIMESLKVLPKSFGSFASTLVEVSAYAGTGNVLKIQDLLFLCSTRTNKQEQKSTGEKDKKEKKKESESDRFDPSIMEQAVAVLGIALIALGEDIGASMSFRLLGHLIRYGEPHVRRAVPLALGLISVSNPQLNVLEMLTKFSHDQDVEIAYNAIFALGLIGAGTNNARLGTTLRQLALYHARDASCFMMVRIAQGLTHLGKGTMTLSPFHSERQLLNPSAMAGLFTTCFCFLDVYSTILSKQHYLLYSLVPAINPRMLITFVLNNDEEAQLIQHNVNVRVGQAVDVVGQAGKPKTITGFQTYSTPVLLGHGERAELATDDCKLTRNFGWSSATSVFIRF
ncbi:26S proteasome non ATPase regulatory subunit [Trichuris trichiura]|uniref:26S proteasome non-ATPase regulatory subunit 2 n=1 Tax=Trichuris trichiura TaxID=36087 RepID=A0A077Z250_TRITR|nr:26S proteasome non ATPase regulatory subunit [Trichuris trichiura]